MGQSGPGSIMNHTGRLSIKFRLLLWFLPIALLPLGLILYTVYSGSRTALERGTRTYLLTFANNKAKQLEGFAVERSKDIAVLRSLPAMHAAFLAYQEAFPAGVESAAYRAADEQHRDLIQKYIQESGYDDLLLISATGDVVFAARSNSGGNIYRSSGVEIQIMETADRALTLLETEISDFRLGGSTESPTAVIGTPILRKGGLLGAILLRLSNRQITKIVSDYTGLGATGETVVGTRQNDRILFVTPLRHESLAEFRKGIEFGSANSLGMQRAITGSKGYGMTVDYRGKKVLAAWRYLPSFRWGLVVKIDEEEAFAAAETARNVVLWGGLGIVGIVIAVTSLLARSLSEPLIGLTGLAQKVSKGDLTGVFAQPVHSTTRDEVAILTSDFSRMTGNLVGLIRGVKSAGVHVASSATHIAAAAKQLESTVSEQAASTNEVVATSKEISSRSRDLSATIDQLTLVAEQAALLAKSGQDALNGMQEATKELVQAAYGISAKLRVLKEQATNIGSVVTTIARVADQTNLLSLNAAIEAEKAGEAGLGFGVVAEEIRRLADQTAESTVDIRRLIEEMQLAVSSGVKSADRFEKDVRQSTGKVEDVSQQLNSIIEHVRTFTPKFEAVNHEMQSQSISAEQIGESMIHLSEAAQNTAESVRDLNEVVEQLNEASRNLQGEVSRFKVSQ